MSKEREVFAAATENWLQLGGSHRFEHMSPHRQVAIIHSESRNADHFRDEAIRLQRFYHTIGQNALILDSLEKVTLEIALQDKAISDVIVIGEGDFSSVYDDEGYVLDWRVVADLTTDLKNSVTQRIHAPQHQVKPGVPFMLFAAGNHTHVYAPERGTFAPGDDDNHNGYVTPVSPRWRMDYAAIERQRGATS